MGGSASITSSKAARSRLVWRSLSEPCGQRRDVTLLESGSCGIERDLERREALLPVDDVELLHADRAGFGILCDDGAEEVLR
jgi:hypothetical protein